MTPHARAASSDSARAADADADADPDHDHDLPGGAAPVDYLFKLVLVGDTGVGKTCLLTRWADGAFQERTRCTIGVDFRIRSLCVAGRRVKAQVWDSAGQERFRALASSYYRGAHGVAVVFDVTSRRTFESVDSWVDEADRFVGSCAARRVVVGNKSDLCAERVVEAHEARDKAVRLGALYVETSARDDDCVGEMFDSIVCDIMRNCPPSGMRAADGGGGGGGGGGGDDAVVVVAAGAGGLKRHKAARKERDKCCG